MTWSHAPDIASRINFLIKNLSLPVPPDRLFCYRSQGSSGRATARIWSLPKIWQQALNTSPGYCVEVISEKFDRLKPEMQEKVLIHELLHIPKNFTGGLVAHRNSRHRTFRHYHDSIDKLYNSLPVKSFE